MVPRARTTTGQRSFAVNGPTVWDNFYQLLCEHMTDHWRGLKHHQKTYLFEHQSSTGAAATVSDCGASNKKLKLNVFTN